MMLTAHGWAVVALMFAAMWMTQSAGAPTLVGWIAAVLRRAFD